MSKYISFPIFIASFLLGIIFIYFWEKKRTVVLFPNPQSYMNVQYKDNIGTCFELSPHQVVCPTDSVIHSIPIADSSAIVD